MRLKRIEITGFKSFSKKTVLTFDVPITAIVGPNGSGKSNIAEAMRWVLGEQSMKSLRGKRGEDLIFNGSNSGSRLNRASVALVFDNSKREFKIDFDEVIIEREVHRDGANVYLVNGSTVRLRDVVELLSTVSLGPSGHHIISQGEADRVLSASPRERKEILEDALGLKIYQYKLAESLKRLEKTEENIKQVELLRREIAPHLKFLKKQVEEAEKVVAQKLELAILARKYFINEQEYLDVMHKTFITESRQTKIQLESIEHDLSRTRKSLESVDQNNGEKDPHLFELEKKISAIRNNKDEISRFLGRVEGKIESIKVEEFVIFNKTTGEQSCKYCGQFIVRSGTSAIVEAEQGRLLVEKKETEEKLRKLVLQEREFIDELDALRVAFSARTENARQSERALYELKAKEVKLRAELENILLREVQYKSEKEVFTRDAHEISFLTGQNVLIVGETDTSNKRQSSGEAGSLPSVLTSRDVQQDLRKKLERLKIKVEDAGGLGADVIKEYEDTRTRDEHLSREIDDLDKGAISLKNLIKELSETLQARFKDGLSLVNKEFDHFFSLLFGGGHASVLVVKFGGGIDETGEEIKEEMGIDISINLPRKKIKGLEMLSGGERALTSIALLFAMSQVNPPPFLVLDETDAALDEANSKKYGEMLEVLSKNSQLIVVTHNRETMSHASVLYGVTMSTDAISKLLSIRFDDAVTYAK